MKATRGEIVAAARELFSEKGYAGASMRDLAERIGLKKASLYMRFDNKEALVPAVMDLLLRDTLAAAAVDRADVGWYPAYAKLVQTLASALTERKRCVGLHLAYGTGEETPLARQSVAAFFQSLRDSMSAILADAMPHETAGILAEDAIVRLEGATLMVAVFDDSKPMERAVETTLREARRAAEMRESRMAG